MNSHALSDKAKNKAKEYMKESIKEISSSEIQEDNWLRYTKNNYFADDISFKEMVESIYTLINKI